MLQLRRMSSGSHFDWLGIVEFDRGEDWKINWLQYADAKQSVGTTVVEKFGIRSSETEPGTPMDKFEG